MKPKLISGILFVYFILIACAPTAISAPTKTAIPLLTSTSFPTPKSIATIVSLKKQWQILESRAAIWHNDAYLASVLIYVGSTDPHQDQLAAIFQSPSETTGGSFTVAITAQGEIIDLWSNDVIMLNAYETPITRQELKVDSQEALDIFAEDEAVAMCLRPRTDSIRPLAILVLYYVDRILTWRLEIQGCSNAEDFKPSIYLNAKNGKIIDLP